MAYRNISAALTILVLVAWATFGFIAQAKRSNGNHIHAAQQTESISLNSPETTAKQNQISDLVAYELFFRTVGANNARGLVERAGLGNEQVEKVIAEGKSLNESYESGDNFKRELRQSKDKSISEKQLGFQRVKEQNETNLERVVTRFLPQGVGADDWQKFQNFIETEVKPNIQIIPVALLNRNKDKAQNSSKVKFIKTASKGTAAQTGGNVYLYSAAWQDGANIFGSGTLAEDPTSYTSYVVTTTVTSPSGRTNTTTGDWNYATVANSTGLSIGFENGTYNVQATFEGDLGGYYDEWGNYISYGTYNVGNSTSAVFLAPRIGVRAIRISPTPTGNTVNSTTARIQADISFDSGVTNESVRINLNRLSNPSDVDYLVGSPTGGTVVAGTGNRGVTVVSVPGDAKTVEWRVDFNNMSPNGNVTESVRIDPSQFPPSSVAVNPEEASVTFGYVKPTPSPTATPTQGGGGCGSCGYAGLGCIGCASSIGTCPYPYFNNSGCCCQGSPIVLDIDGNGFAMTNGANGVSFDLGGDGVRDQTSWTAASSDDAWLALDRNENNVIDNGKELFGNYCDQPAPPPGVLRNGFIGLAEYDKAANGGNGDGKITRADAVFRKLRLWQDKNHNGISEAEELSRLPALDVVALFLDYSESNRTDQYGNRFKFRARVRDARGARVGRWAWDVFTVPRRTN